MTPDSERDEAEAPLWSALRGKHGSTAREALVLRYLWLARATALDIYRERSYKYDLDVRELTQLGTVGLIEAVDRYQPGRGIGFPAFARKRLRGAILNGIDQHSEVRAQVAASRALRRERLRSLADATSEPDRLRRLREVAVGLAVGLMLEDTAMFVQENSEVSAPYSSGEAVILREQFKQVVVGLPEQQRKVVQMHYYNEMPFAQVADLMGLSRGRISQIHAKAIGRIREMFADSAGYDEIA